MSELIVRKFMTPAPHTISADQTLATAHAMMRNHQIRHLPVLQGTKLVGMVTQRDLLFIENLPGVDPASVTVEDAMSQPFAITPDSSLEWVVMEMAQRKYGSTIVLEHGKVVGVFTMVDALKALQELLRLARRQHKPRAHTRRAS